MLRSQAAVQAITETWPWLVRAGLPRFARPVPERQKVHKTLNGNRAGAVAHQGRHMGLLNAEQLSTTHVRVLGMELGPVEPEAGEVFAEPVGVVGSFLALA